MADDEKATPVAPPEPAPAPATPRTIENPMMSWMRGGTMTTAYENELARQKAEAAKSRQVEDQRARTVAENPHEAKQYKHVVGGNKKHPGIVLEVRHPKDNTVLDYIECELTVDPSDGSLILVMACWKCALRGVTDNFKFSQKHKRFELDMRRQGELWVNPLNPSHIVTLAGTIQLTETVTCPNLGCGCRFVIDNSVVREK